MPEQVTLGLSKIEIGELAVGGGPATTFEKFGTEYEGSTSYEVADGTDSEVRSDEQDDPLFSITRPGTTTFTFEIASYDPDVMAAYMGGTVDAGPPKVYNEPDSTVTQERTIRITSEFGLIATINRGSMTAKMVGKFNRDATDPMRIQVNVKVLKPTLEGTPRVTWAEKA